MAEYINREDLKFLAIPIAPVLQGEQVHYEQGILKEWLESVHTADVIERSKIDKAIKEIDDLNLSWVASHYEDRFYGFQQEVLEILKRNIGD